MEENNKHVRIPRAVFRRRYVRYVSAGSVTVEAPVIRESYSCLYDKPVLKMKRLNVRSDPNGIPLGLFFFSGDLFFIGRIFPKGRKYCARFIDDPSRRCILLWSRYCSTLILILNPADIQHNKIKQAQNAMFYLCCTCKKINAQLISSQAFETVVCTPDGNRTHINRTGT